MSYLDFSRLEAIDAEAFRAREPYPWVNPPGLLTDDGYRRLAQSVPDAAQFTRLFGIQRSHGQTPHDRLALEYRDGLNLTAPWHEFIDELKGARYGAFLRRLFGRGFLKLNFHWHYTPNGCSVSPHCDATRKLGSHIFYFNTPDDWDPAWGGETLILDDGGRIPRKSAPGFEDFDRVLSSTALGNYSLLFARRDKSWHGVREIRCPENRYRKVFIVVINDWVLAQVRHAKGLLRGEVRADY